MWWIAPNIAPFDLYLSVQLRPPKSGTRPSRWSKSPIQRTPLLTPKLGQSFSYEDWTWSIATLWMPNSINVELLSAELDQSLTYECGSWSIYDLWMSDLINLEQTSIMHNKIDWMDWQCGGLRYHRVSPSMFMLSNALTTACTKPLPHSNKQKETPRWFC